MTALLLPFAIRKTDGEFVTAEDVERGLKCDCICPGCTSAVMAKQGTEKIWHFAHHRSPACANGYEKSVHELAKQLIRNRKQLLLPALEAVTIATDAFGEVLVEREPIFDARSCELEKCSSGIEFESVTPDVLGQLKGRQIIVEITVFHRLGAEKRIHIEKTGIAAFEIDLSRFKTEQATLSKLEEAIFSEASNRKWLFHPRLAAAEVIASQRLNERLRHSRIRFDAESEVREKRRAEFDAKRKAECAFRDSANALRVSSYQLQSEPRWRACFPNPQEIHAARQSLSERTSKSIDAIADITGQITKRGELQSVTPRELSARWAEELGVSQQELMLYFDEGRYIL